MNYRLTCYLALVFPFYMEVLTSRCSTYTDQGLAVAKLRKIQARLEVIDSANIPHIWPWLPVMKEGNWH